MVRDSAANTTSGRSTWLTQVVLLAIERLLLTLKARWLTLNECEPNSFDWCRTSSVLGMFRRFPGP